MSEQPIRIGLIGAGANTRLHHIPGFQAIDGVELVAVCNRSEESGRRVAEEFGIARVVIDPEAIFADATIDAVCIGTWPYRHQSSACARSRPASTCSARRGWPWMRPRRAPCSPPRRRGPIASRSSYRRRPTSGAGAPCGGCSRTAPSASCARST